MGDINFPEVNTMSGNHDLPNQDIIKRINRLIGHLQGVGRMISDNRSCVEIIHQLSACEAATAKLKRAIAEDHIRNCLLHDHQQVAEELFELLRKY